MENKKIYRLMNHDSMDGNTPIFECFTLAELNERFGTNYSSIEEAIEDDPEYLFNEYQMIQFIAE